MIEVELYTRPGCHLCDEMKGALRDAARGLEVLVKEVDISADETLIERYGWDIPLLFVNGSKAFKHRTTVQRLRERLLAEEEND